jgi:hypothetical protein
MSQDRAGFDIYQAGAFLATARVDAAILFDIYK